MKLARAVRVFEQGVSEATLTWSEDLSCLHIEYRELTEDGGFRIGDVPAKFTKNWLPVFVRDPAKLKADSYHVTESLSFEWFSIIDGLVSGKPLPPSNAPNTRLVS